MPQEYLLYLDERELPRYFSALHRNTEAAAEALSAVHSRESAEDAVYALARIARPPYHAIRDENPAAFVPVFSILYYFHDAARKAQTPPDALSLWTGRDVANLSIDATMPVIDDIIDLLAISLVHCLLP